VPTFLFRKLRKREIDKAPKVLAQRHRILNSLTDSKSKYLVPKDSDLLRSQAIEQIAVVKELSNIGSRYFRKGSSGNLNKKIQELKTGR
jgi:5'-3' exonuclease